MFVQVEEGSAKPGRDFTHSTAGLIQFDPGLTLLDSVQVSSALVNVDAVRRTSIDDVLHPVSVSQESV